MRKSLVRIFAILVSPILLVFVYLFAALLGGIIPASFNTIDPHASKIEKPIYLLSNLLHTDIAIPINNLTLAEFSFLKEAGMPLDNPALQYLIIGWGSEAFYTSTGEYSDIKPATAWKAITGDSSVMHIAPAGDLVGQNFRKLEMPNQNFANLVKFIKAGFSKANGEMVLLQGKTFGFGDVFYKAEDHFNILNPCNQWASAALREAGFGTGIWTPTAYSFSLGYSLYN